jgi:hypothetical protein
VRDPDPARGEPLTTPGLKLTEGLAQARISRLNEDRVPAGTACERPCCAHARRRALGALGLQPEDPIVIAAAGVEALTVVARPNKGV